MSNCFKINWFFKDGAHQYITIPLSMTPGGAGLVNKQNSKDDVNINGRESPPNQEVTIKKECSE